MQLIETYKLDDEEHPNNTHLDLPDRWFINFRCQATPIYARLEDDTPLLVDDRIATRRVYETS